MYYIVLGVDTGRPFLKDGCYSQQIISDGAKGSLIYYNLRHRVPEMQNL